jgi:hypothetical protein
MVRHWSAYQIGSLSHWSAYQIGSLSWFGLTHIKETGDPIRLGSVPGSNAGTCAGSREHAAARILVRPGIKEPSWNARPHSLGFTRVPLAEKRAVRND